MKASFISPSETQLAGRVWLGDQRIPARPGREQVEGRFVDFAGQRCYRISQYDQLAPFLMTVVSASNHWLFVSSTGGLTCGRAHADRALFPYLPVDRLHDSASVSGPFTVMLAERGGRTQRWEPFHPTGRAAYRLTRNLYKSVIGHRLFFEEINHDLGLTWRAEWTTTERFGFVRGAELHNDGTSDVSLRVVDGLRNLLPAGIPRRLANEMSCLTDAYKRAELIGETNLAVFALTSGITDQPIVLESLVATTAWCHGLPKGRVLLSEQQLEGFRQGTSPRVETEARGIRGCYAIYDSFELEPGAARNWALIADQGLSQVDVVALEHIVSRADAGDLVHANIELNGTRLHEIVGHADGLHSGGDEAATTHHFANVLFNVMRGGGFRQGSLITTADLSGFITERNRACAARHVAWLAGLSPSLPCAELRRMTQERGDPDLERLFLEYLPLSFSRRHGDPSRPWNRFSIRLRNDDGSEVFEYEGNWRDIFQNWEALALAFPEFLDHMVAKFVNASTVDGHNPYRVTRRGVEWEVPTPDDPWAGIGYWGDHQIVYLLRLLEWAERFAPGRLQQWLERELFSYADVPYRIATYDEMRRDPRVTIQFLAEQDTAIRARESREGSDARLLHDAAGRVRHVTLAEKLLLTALARIAHLVPGGGIWMNTQRPEWNDANNALVGYGVSGVTLASLRRYLVFCRQLFSQLDRPVKLSGAVAEFAAALLTALRETSAHETAAATMPTDRRRTVDALAGAGSRYRERVYATGLGEPTWVATESLRELIDAALPLVDASLHALRRRDGLFHSYRLLRFGENQIHLEDLPLMLEGQVAVLTSGILDPHEVVALLRRLRESSLYAADRHSYLLYPDGTPNGFLQRNVVPEALVHHTPVFGELLRAGDRRLICRDAQGTVRFHHELINAAALNQRLDCLTDDPAWGERIRRDRAAVQAAYETVFRHRGFTGRSGAMFAYEGLGSIYWHMVSKLLLAVQECHARAIEEHHPAAPVLARRYWEIRQGLGFNKSPREWGAFPTDPYSHTPRHAGAQQPGMTGQVKEGILTRLGELGVVVSDGHLRFAPRLLRQAEFAAPERSFSWINASGAWDETRLPADALAFTFCGTLVVYTLTSAPEIEAVVTYVPNEFRRISNARLSCDDSASVFKRNGRVHRIGVTVPRDWLIDSLLVS